MSLVQGEGAPHTPKTPRARVALAARRNQPPPVQSDRGHSHGRHARRGAARNLPVTSLSNGSRASALQQVTAAGSSLVRCRCCRLLENPLKRRISNGSNGAGHGQLDPRVDCIPIRPHVNTPTGGRRPRGRGVAGDISRGIVGKANAHRAFASRGRDVEHPATLPRQCRRHNGQETTMGVADELSGAIAARGAIYSPLCSVLALHKTGW